VRSSIALRWRAACGPLVVLAVTTGSAGLSWVLVSLVLI
jgi:hypothetical protein